MSDGCWVSGPSPVYTWSDESAETSIENSSIVGRALEVIVRVDCSVCGNGETAVDVNEESRVDKQGMAYQHSTETIRLGK